MLAEHWDGSAWSVINAPLPSTANTAGELLGVATIDPDDAWAVGNDQNGGALAALIEHWDGTSWQSQALPANEASGVVLNAITALGPHDLWAAGVNYDDDEPVLLHGDGAGWQRITIPGVGVSGAYDQHGEVNALVADGTDGIYLIGVAYLSSSDPGHALIEHWDGMTRRTPIPDPPATEVTGHRSPDRPRSRGGTRPCLPASPMTADLRGKLRLAGRSLLVGVLPPCAVIVLLSRSVTRRMPCRRFAAAAGFSWPSR